MNSTLQNELNTKHSTLHADMWPYTTPAATLLWLA